MKSLFATMNIDWRIEASEFRNDFTVELEENGQLNLFKRRDNIGLSIGFMREKCVFMQAQLFDCSTH